MSRHGFQTPGSLTTYFQVINHLLDNYDSDDIVEIDEEDVTRCVQMDRMTEAELEALLWKKELMCGSLFTVERLKSI